MNLMKESDIERQTSTLLQHCFKMVSSCTVDQRFFILTSSVFLVQSQIRLSYPDFFQSIQIVFSLANQFD